jgi:hypothetical protein
MRLQFEHLQEQLATAREVHINELRNTNTRLNESILNVRRPPTATATATATADVADLSSSRLISSRLLRKRGYAQIWRR